MSNLTSKVTITANVRDLGDTKKARYQVRWKVDGVPEKSAAFPSKKAAETFKGRLLAAQAAGELFDRRTREPVSWGASVHGPNLATYTRERIARNWKRWKGTSRRSALEGPACWLPAFAPRDLGKPRDEVYSALMAVLNPEVDATRAQEDLWRRLVAATPPIGSVDRDKVEKAVEACWVLLDGTKASHKYARRRRILLGEMLNDAVADGHLASSPLKTIKTTRAQQATIRVDAREVGEAVDVMRLLAAAKARSEKWFILFALMYYAGLRPSEAVAVRWKDFKALPETGWGTLTLRKAAPAAGTQYTDNGDVREEGGLKWRQADATRTVPLPPVLVAALRAWAKHGAKRDDLVCPGRGGKFAGSTTIYREFRLARATGLTNPDAMLLYRPYSLRHSAASLWLGTPGATPSDVAERLGHSTSVLLDVYADVLETHREAANAGIDDAFTKAAAQLERAKEKQQAVPDVAELTAELERARAELAQLRAAAS